MDRLDAIVIGLGVMGAAALDALAERGARVLGIDRFEPPHAMGSSHGRTRVIRKAYFEDPAYVPLLHRSWSAWEDLERGTGERLLLRTGALHLGPPDHAGIEGVRRAAREHGLAAVELDARAVEARFPAFRPDPRDVGILEEDGGILFAERCVGALLARARSRGAATAVGERVLAIDLDHPEHVAVRTERRALEARTIVLAQGAWSEGDASVIPIPVPLRVERQVQLWLEPRAPELVAPGRMPVFIRFGPDGAFYGIPDVESAGIKVCAHHGGELTRAEALDRSLRDDDEARVRAFVRAQLPAADGPRKDARVCMYTNTPDDHFVVGAHPDHPRVVIACGFSGHGFKLAPSVGALVAEHALGGRDPLPLFDPRRFAITG